jgi:hypothetical protein
MGEPMIDNLFADRLTSGERILWTGRPGRGIILSSQDVFLVPFSLLWCGFAVFWTVSATGLHAPGFFTLWGLMFVAIGLYFVAGRFFFDAWVRSGIGYAVTNRRILILRSGPFSRFISLNLDRLPSLDMRENARGRGTIRFGQPASMFGNRNMSAWSPALDPTPQFIAIDDARRVFDLIQTNGKTAAGGF